MPTLFLRFPARRYHATPWGHHVNEGLIEWPPSPWRLLRALLSIGYTSGLWNGSGPSAEGRSLIEKLAGVLPTYCLPPASGAHSRHYMPLATLKALGASADISYVLAHQIAGSPIVYGYKEDTTLVFDTWAQVDDGELAVTWDVPLSDAETELLAQLAERIGYLGRAESWVVARLAKAGEPVPSANCSPENVLANPGPGWEQVPLLVLVDVQEYLQWRAGEIVRVTRELPAIPPEPPPIVPPSGKAAKSELKKLEKQRNALLEAREQIQQRHAEAVALYPADLIACLQVETNWLRKHGWSQPPGSRRVFYWRKVDALEVGAPQPRRRTPEAPPVEAMLLSMATASGNNHALPHVSRALPQAEMLHRHLGSALKRLGLGHSVVLSGCDESGTPLKGRHEHTHILPLDLDGDHHLDHFLIWAPMGLDARAQKAIRAVRKTFTKGGADAMKLALVGAGALRELRTLAGLYGDGLRRVLGSNTGATQWESATPFVPPRHLKKRGKNTIEGQVVAELASRGLPEPTEIRVLDLRGDPQRLQLRHFIRTRRDGPAPPIDIGFSIALHFAEPIQSPLALGFGCHFGLGMFRRAIR